jgi:putative addiction module component (TIGR02574 family)
MTTPSQAILDAALALSEDERIQLVERLLESLSAEPDELTDDELFSELERRHAEYQRDPSVAIPWTDLEKE